MKFYLSRTLDSCVAAVLVTIALLVPVSSAEASTGALQREMSDDEFIASLATLPAHEDLDRRRLARVFFGVAATLEGGRSSVQLLHGNLVIPDSSRQAVLGLLRNRFESYSQSLDRFRQSSARLLDQPESLLLLYRNLVDGQRACWSFDLHNRLIEAYGTDSDQLSILASREACSRMRTVAFEARVESVIRDALVEHVFQKDEFNQLQTELDACEGLVEALSEIDDGE